MKRQHLQKITSGFLIFCLMLSFSISVFAAAFTGAYMTTETDPVTGQVTTVIKDVNPSGQTFSGQNVIEMNAYNNSPTLTNNTFNGSTDINPDFTSITSSGNAYNGSVDINYDGLGGNLDSNGDRFQSTTVTAEQSDISISNGTFNGSTTINAQSVSLGSISQMDSLLDQIFQFSAQFTETYATPNQTSYITRTNPITGHSVQIPVVGFDVRVLTYNPSTGFTTTNNFYYGTYRSIVIQSFQGTLFYTIRSVGQCIQNLIDTFVGSGNHTFYQITIDQSGEFFTLSSSTSSGTWRDVIDNRWYVMIIMFNFYFQRFYNWYYPLDNVLPEYWRYYNTDTAQQEEIGLAGLMYNISWYLGQMYVLQSASESLDNFTDQVEAVTETFEEAEQEEQEIMDSISSGIESFNPDLSELGTFKALGWCSNYLQLVFLRLGTYGTVILIGLLLGVCMQFIGYFRYKT